LDFRNRDCDCHVPRHHGALRFEFDFVEGPMSWEDWTFDTDEVREEKDRMICRTFMRIGQPCTHQPPCTIEKRENSLNPKPKTCQRFPADARSNHHETEET
jgi:hypothetical protein